MVILVVLLRTITTVTLTPETPRHIGGSDPASSGYEGWDYRAADGATVSGTRAVADGSTRFAMTTLNRASVNNNGATNAFYGAQNFKGCHGLTV